MDLYYSDLRFNLYINHLNIKITAELKQAEADIVAASLIRIEQEPLPAAFTFDYLISLHQQLFQEIYPWAGVVRTDDISKGISHFAPATKIPRYAGMIFNDLNNREFMQENCSDEDFITGTAKLLTQINNLHPFYEGNGRSQRLFLSKIAIACGYQFDWTKAHQWEIEAAAIRGIDDDYEPHQRLLARIASKIQK